MRTEHFYVRNLPLSKEMAIVLQTFGYQCRNLNQNEMHKICR
jgi:hypothetical protein